MIMVSRLQSNVLALMAAMLVALVMLFINEMSHWRSRVALNKLNELSATGIHVQRLLLSVTDAETALLGYLLTSRREYLESHIRSLKDLSATIKLLKRRSPENENRAQSMARLEEALVSQLSVFTDLKRLYDEDRHDTWHEFLMTSIPKERMDALRTTAEMMLLDEAKGSELAHKEVHRTLLINRIGINAMTALSLLALFMYARQTQALNRQRREQQAAIKTQRDQLEIEVQRRTGELTDLSRHLMTAREDERNRLSRELHDELGALLTTAKLDAARIKTRVASLSPEITERIDHLNETLNSGIALKRRIIEDLYPSSLSNLGLVAALQILVREFGERLEVKVDASLQAVALQPDNELTVYRLVQEALTNASKYAKATDIRVCLAAHNGVAEISVTDNGIGFDPALQKVSGHGLLGMRYRVEAGGGALKLQSALGQGTRVSATLPLTTPT